MLNMLEKNLIQKAEQFEFVKNLPINDYEIYAEIKIYLKDKIIPISFDVDFKNKNLSLKKFFKIHSKNKEIDTINYTFKIILQKFFLIKPLKINRLLSEQEIIEKFNKYKQIFNSIEKNLLWLHSKIGGKKKFYFNEYGENNCYGYIVDFIENKEKPLEFSKYLKGTFLMKEIEKIYGTYFFRNSYEIWSEIIFEEYDEKKV